MKETPAEVAALQTLLEASLAGATGHLRAIVTPAAVPGCPGAVRPAHRHADPGPGHRDGDG